MARRTALPAFAAPFHYPTGNYAPGKITHSSQNQTPAEFVIKSGINQQLHVSQYYGSWSGPGLLICKESHVLEGVRDVRRFPKHKVPDHVELFDFYYRKIHWFISCIEWAEFVGWLDDSSENEPIVNALIWMVLCITCIVKGRQEEARQYEREALELFPAVYNIEPCQSQTLLLFQIVRLNVLLMRGQFEELWSRLGSTIHTAMSMGFHRKWPFASANRERRKARIWYTILHMERALAIFFGRPYSIGDHFYDCENPLDASSYDYETTFRDSVNGMVPLMGRLLDELVLPEDSGHSKGSPSKDRQRESYDRLLRLDQDLSKWIFSLNKDMCNTCRGTQHVHFDKRPPMMVVQHLFIEGVKSFLKSRIHRLFLMDEDLGQRSYSTEQYLLANHTLASSVDILRERDVALAVHQMTFVVVDTALYCCVKEGDPNMRVGCLPCVEDTQIKLRQFLAHIMDVTTTSGKRLASSCLHIMDKFEWHRTNDDTRLREMFAESVDPTNWLVWLNNIEWLGD